MSSLTDRRVNSPLLRGRLRKLTGEQVEFVLSVVSHTPDIYLDEIAALLLDVHGVQLSVQAVSDLLLREGIAHKKLKKTASERSVTRRQEFLAEIGVFPAEYLVAIDESAVNTLTATRLYGRSRRGARAVVSAPFVRGNKYSVLPALSVDGIVYAQMIEGSFDGDQFCTFIQQLLPYLNPYPGPRSVVLMDNCRIHHVDGVEGLFTDAGVRILYLPPYSPDYNPIEECFGWMKSEIRRQMTEYHLLTESEDEAAISLFLYNILSRVTPQLARSWFDHCGYID